MHEEAFFSSQKKGKTYEINSKAVLGFRMIGKGRSALEKVSSVLGLASPITNKPYSQKTKVLVEKSREVMEKCLKTAGELAKKIEKKNKW